MNSLILQTATRFLLPLLLLFSVFLLMRGHNSPGGGFAGGLVAARQSLRADTLRLIGVGLLVALTGGTISLFGGWPWFTGLWTVLPWTDRFGVHVGTPLLFDIGVYLTVAGVALTIVLTLAEEE